MLQIFSASQLYFFCDKILNSIGIKGLHIERMQRVKRDREKREKERWKERKIEKISKDQFNGFY
jgi:hypothetical protein